MVQAVINSVSVDDARVSARRAHWIKRSQRLDLLEIVIARSANLGHGLHLTSLHYG